MTQTALLGDIAEINPTTAVSAALDDPCTFVPMNAVNEDDAAITTYATRPYRDVAKGYVSFAEKDVLLAKITPCMENGKCAIPRGLLRGYGFGSTEFHVLRATSQIMPEWIYYYWRLPETRVLAERNMTGTAGQKRVPVAFLQELPIPLPSVDRQRDLVRSLQRADGLRRMRRYALQMCDEVLPAEFTQMFGDLNSNSKSWETMALGELIVSGPQNGIYKPAASYGSGWPILRIDAFHDGRLAVSKLKRLRLAIQKPLLMYCCQRIWSLIASTAVHI